MNQKEQLINETLNSLSGIQKAEADPFLYEKVMNKIQLRKTSPSVYVWNYRWQLAALVVLLIVNTFFVLRTNSSENKTSSSAAFANEYFGKSNAYNY